MLRDGRSAHLDAAGARLFATAMEPETIMDGLVSLCVPGLADWCIVTADGVAGTDTLAVAHADPARTAWAWGMARRFPAGRDADSGVGLVLRTGEPVLVPEITDEMLVSAARDEEHLAALRELGVGSAMLVPISVRGRVLGVVSLLREHPARAFGPDELAAVEDLAQRAGMALETARLDAAERGERARASFLAEASAALDAPLGVDERIRRLVSLVIPRVADLCTVRMLDPAGALRLAEAGHRDPSLEAVAHRVYPHDGVPPGDQLHEVLHGGRATLIPRIDDDMLAGYASEPGMLEDMRLLRLRSAMMVPLPARGRAIGVLSLMRTGDSAPYDAHDLTLAEELGRRAGLAIENARLYDEERVARARAEADRERITRLQRVGDALGGALDRREVGRVIVAQGMAALSAVTGVVAIRSGGEGRLVASAGYPEEVAERIERFTLDERIPLAHVLRTGEEVWLESREDWLVRFGEPAAPFPTGVCLPLEHGGRVEGAVAFRFPLGERRIDAGERAFVRALAHQCAQALARAERYEAQHEVAIALQRSLLPPPPPPIPGTEIAQRYLAAGPALEAGGDWYDIMALPGGRVGVVVGDVVGRGVEAAAAMGQLQSALRAFALEGDAPSAVLERLFRFAARTPLTSMATVAYAVLDPADGRLRYSCAGHPPPLLVRADGTAAYLEGGRGLPLGVDERADQPEDEARVDPGDMLLLYSDGLVERRRESLDAGLARLELAAREVVAEPAERVCERILTAVFPDGPPADDVALLLLRRTALDADRFERRVPARPRELGRLRGGLRQWLAAGGATRTEVDEVLLAVGEALANSVEHAYLGRRAGELELTALRMPDGTLRVTVRDFGRWRETVLGRRRGRGAPLMREVMDAVDVASGIWGTTVLMERTLGRARA
jgi:serine phosphatase RsbU (regulator of sigma subunit)/anti-sigma regulatory factor (Ser/Thr protein kinase)